MREKMLELHRTQLVHCGDYIPDKFAAHPVLMTLDEKYDEFYTPPRNLLRALEDGPQAIVSQIYLALELFLAPMAKFQLRNVIGDDRVTLEVWHNIRMLSKVPKLWPIFIVATRNLPQMRFLDVVLLDPPDYLSTSVGRPQSLKETLRHCGLSPDEKAVRTYISSWISMERTLALHEEFQRLNPMVPAEVNVITNILQKGWTGVSVLGH